MVKGKIVKEIVILSALTFVVTFTGCLSILGNVATDMAADLASELRTGLRTGVATAVAELPADIEARRTRNAIERVTAYAGGEILGILPANDKIWGSSLN